MAQIPVASSGPVIVISGMKPWCTVRTPSKKTFMAAISASGPSKG